MSRFTIESLAELRQRVDLIDVLSGHLNMKRAGAAYKACCPFHDEKTPSFMVQQGDTHYHCFGCGAHGDAIEFLMTFLRMSFVEAVEHLADRFQVRIERTEGGDDQGRERKRLREVMRAAAQLYHTLLLHTSEGHEALQYLYERGLDLPFIERFQIGLAPATSGIVTNALRELKFDKQLLQTAGILSARGGEFFRGRILFPICDATGTVIGFSGRKYKEGTTGGKYINTPDTPLFHKSRVLYGLDHSRRRIARERRALIVEGQIDALRLIHTGLDIAVAGQGTAFGAGQAEELMRLGVQEVFLAMDGDRAGQEATAKVGDLFQSKGIEVRVVPIPPGSDPDALLNDGGPEAFLALLKQATPYLNFLVDHIGSTLDRNSPAGKSELVRCISKQIQAWEDPVMVHESLRQLANLTHLPEETLGITRDYRPSPALWSRAQASSITVDVDRIIEEDVLRWLLRLGTREEWMVPLASENLPLTAFHIPILQTLYATYLEAPGDLLDIAVRSGKEEAQETISSLLERRLNPERAREQFPRAISRLLERNWMNEREAIRRQIQSGAHSDDEVLTLVKKFDALNAHPPQLK